jgi:hypothetical protein
MPRPLRCVGLLLLTVGLFVPAFAQDKPKLDQPAKDKKDVEKMISAGEITGKIVSLDPAQRHFSVQVMYRYAVPNQGAYQNLINLQRQAAEAARNPNPFERQRRFAEIQQAMAREQANLYQLSDEGRDAQL